MEKTVKINRKDGKMTVEISMTFEEFQDLRSFMNTCANTHQYRLFNEMWSKVPMRFREMLLKEDF